MVAKVMCTRVTSLHCSISACLAAPLPNTTLWQTIHSTAATQRQQQGLLPVVVNLMGDASIAEGAPGNPGPQPLNTTSFPGGGKWYTLQQSLQAALIGDFTRLPEPPRPSDVLALTQSLVVQSSPTSNMTAQLDLRALQRVFRLPTLTTNATLSNSSNASSSGRNATTTSNAPVTLTFSNLTLFNLPPGPSSTYPLGMSTIMMWSVDMDR
jgi:hypothetical protein